MNDEFLYRLRKDPPPEFAARLQARLDLQARKSLFAPRSSLIRTLAAVFLVGGSALAGATFAVKGVPAVILSLFGASNHVSITTEGSMAPHAAVAGRVKIPGQPAERATAQASAPHALQPMEHDSARTAAGNEETIAQPRSRPSLAGGASAAFTGAAGAPLTGDPLRIVGPSATYAQMRSVADMFSHVQGMQQPQIESHSMAIVFRDFCSGTQPPDIALATGRITTGELEMCRGNGVRSVVELKIGYQAVVLTSAKMGTPLKLAARDVYLALAKQIPDPAEPAKLIDNPNQTWDQVNPSLELRRIEVLGPPPDSTARHAFAEFVLEAGCDTYAWIRALKDSDEERYQRICHTLREDGPYVDAEPNANLIPQRLWAAPNTLAILDYGFYERHKDQLIGSLLEGPDPIMESIVAGRYPAARTLYVYINKARVHRVPRFSSLLAGCLIGRDMQPFGCLERSGLIPLEEEQRRALRANVLQLNELKF